MTTMPWIKSVYCLCLSILLHNLTAQVQEQPDPYLLKTLSRRFPDLVLEKQSDTLYKKGDNQNFSLLELQRDSSFIYCYVSKWYFDIAKGRYKSDKNSVTLTWDSSETERIAKDPVFYKRHFKSGKPNPLKIQGIRFIHGENSLTPDLSMIHPDKDDRLELLLKSRDLYKMNSGIDSMVDIRYNVKGDRLLISHGKNSELQVPAKSVWGFVIFRKNNVEVYRRTSKGFNWYGIPGVKLVELDKLVLYTVGNDKRYTCFSRGLDAPIFMLEHKNIRKAFPDEREFQEIVKKEFPTEASLTEYDEFLRSYRFVEVYKSYRWKSAGSRSSKKERR